MNRNSSQVMTAAAVLFASAFSAQIIFAACDGVAASSSVGACYTPQAGQYLCSSMTSQVDCTDCSNISGVTCISVNQDFPTWCPTSPNNNCNEPLADCWMTVKCQWKSGKCQSGTPGLWQTAPKRTTVPCPQ